jgi:V/A-type H+-transporting ATPase subunit E
MSLETVVEDIRDEARARAEELRAAGDERAAALIEAADDDAQEIVAEAKREVEREIEQEREQTLSSATLGAKQERLEARREVLQEVREAVEAAVAGIDGERREELTRALLDATTAEFDEQASVYGRAADRELFEGILTEYDGYEWGGEYDCLGGVVVETEESRVRVNNTFDSVLEEVWDDDLREISAELFEEQ